jgi:hypothetical protein
MKSALACAALAASAAAWGRGGFRKMYNFGG